MALRELADGKSHDQWIAFQIPHVHLVDAVTPERLNY
jgi:hypothetical protein